jgi:hypothetical protein
MTMQVTPQQIVMQWMQVAPPYPFTQWMVMVTWMNVTNGYVIEKLKKNMTMKMNELFLT